MVSDGYEVNEDASDDDGMQAEAVSSFLPLKPLFQLNFRPPKMRKLVLAWQSSQSETNSSSTFKISP